MDVGLQTSCRLSTVCVTGTADHSKQTVTGSSYLCSLLSLELKKEKKKVPYTFLSSLIRQASVK